VTAFKSLGIIPAFLLAGWSLSGQIVNIENRRMHTDSVRTAGSASIAFSFTENNNKQLLVSRNALALQLKSKSLKDLFLILGNYDLSLADGASFSNAGFLHFRYNRKLFTSLRWEAFTQTQYNRVLGIGTRALVGSGPRWKCFQSKGTVGYFGALYMYEYEVTSGDTPIYNRDHRLSSYLSVSMDLPKWLPGELISTTYYQPKFGEWADFRVNHETSLELQIHKKLRATTRLNYFHDQEPPQGISRSAIAVEQGFRILF
jgi:hypothetical protein